MPEAHRRTPAGRIGCAVLTASDSRDESTDESGRLIREQLAAAGLPVHLYRVVPDQPSAIRAALAEAEADRRVRVVLANGGTGVAPRDRTFETISGRLQRTLPGFGELFRMLSYQEIGPAAMLSRAVAGVRDRRAYFSMPGSPAAVRLAMERLILPEIGHLVGLLDADGDGGVSPSGR